MFRASSRHTTPDFDLLVPETRNKRQERRIFNNDVEDAEFVTVEDQLSRPFENDNRRKAGIDRVERAYPWISACIGLLAKIERMLCRLSINHFAALIAAAAAAMFVIMGGLNILTSSAGAREVSTAPLGLSYVNITPHYIDGQEILVISGVLANSGDLTTAVPKLKAELTTAQGELVANMLIEPPIQEIKPGNSHGFSAKLRHPGGKTPQIKLSFALTDVSAP